jgi:hypothetical protein
MFSFRGDARRTSALVTECSQNLGPLYKVKLLENNGEKAVVRCPEKAGVERSTPSLDTIIPIT